MSFILDKQVVKQVSYSISSLVNISSPVSCLDNIDRSQPELSDQVFMDSPLVPYPMSPPSSLSQDDVVVSDSELQQVACSVGEAVLAESTAAFSLC